MGIGSEFQDVRKLNYTMENGQSYVQEYCHLANFKGQSSFILSLPLSLFQVSELGQEARALARSPRDG